MHLVSQIVPMRNDDGSLYATKLFKESIDVTREEFVALRSKNVRSERKGAAQRDFG